MTAVIAVTSGTLQVGISTLSANLARYLNVRGYRTGLLVAGGRAPLWETQPKCTWPHILDGGAPLDQAIHRDRFGVDLLITQDHGHTLDRLSAQATERMANAIGSLDAYTYLIVDMAAGPNAASIAGCLAATETLLVISPDTPTLTAAYEWLARMARHGFAGPINIVLNQVKKPALAQSVYMRFRDLAQKKLNLQTNLWGSMTEDNGVRQAGNLDRPLSLKLPKSKLVNDIHLIGDRLVAEQPPENQTQPLDIIWHLFIDRLRKLPVIPASHQQSKASSKKRETPASPATPRPSKTPPTPPLDLSEDLRQITEQLTTIANELSGIRHLLENRTPGLQPMPGQEEVRPADRIELDFDAFIASQLSSE